MPGLYKMFRWLKLVFIPAHILLISLGIILPFHLKPITMACVQACGSAEAYTKKHSIVHDLLKAAHNLFHKHCDQRQEISHAVVGGHIHNITKGEIKLQSKHEWSGRNKCPYPHNIAQRHAGTFVHSSGCGDSADIAAVVYAASTKAGSTDNLNCAYLVAWSVRDHHIGSCTVNKVYVEAGPIDDYIEIDWCKIKAKLDASCNTSYYIDETTGCEAFARISKGHQAAFVASFSTIC